GRLCLPQYPLLPPLPPFFSYATVTLGPADDLHRGPSPLVEQLVVDAEHDVRLLPSADLLDGAQVDVARQHPRRAGAPRAPVPGEALIGAPERDRRIRHRAVTFEH